MLLLMESAVRSLLLGIVVWGVMKILRVQHPQARLTIWTMVLAGLLTMPLLVRLVPVKIPAPVPEIPFVTSIAPAEILPAANMALAPSNVSAGHSVIPARRSLDWAGAATNVYFIVAGMLLARMLAGLSLTVRLWWRARPFGEDWVSGLNVRVSADVVSPVTLGSTILLPSDCGGWPVLKRKAVLLHERSHVANGDFDVQLAAALNCAVFWFTPLSWWLRAQLIGLAETISDNAVIAALDDRAAYAEILLGVAMEGGTEPIGVAMARPQTLARRVDRILSETTLSKGLTGPGRIFAALAIVPAIAGAACATPNAESATTFSPGPDSDWMGGTIDGQTLPDARVSVENWMAGIIDSQAVPAAWPTSIELKTGNTCQTITQQGDCAFWLNPKINADHVLFRENSKFYYLDDPTTVKQASQLSAPPQTDAQREFDEEWHQLGDDQTHLTKQVTGLHRDEAGLRGEVAAAPSPDIKADLIRHEGELGRQVGMLERRIRDDQMQMGKMASDRMKIPHLASEEVAKSVTQYEQFRSLLDVALKKGLAKSVDTFAEPLLPAEQPPRRVSVRDPAMLVSENLLTSPQPVQKSELIQAWQLRRKIKGDYLWFQHEQRSYYVTDPATLGQIRALTGTPEERENHRRREEEYERISRQRTQDLAALRGQEASLVDQDERVRAAIAAEESPEKRDQLKKQEADILGRVEALGKDIGDFKDIDAEIQKTNEIIDSEGIPDWPKGGPNVHMALVVEVLTTALNKGLAKPTDQ
jgi:beta-lactamase regulating signal transducer with metallopeptidase domain